MRIAPPGTELTEVLVQDPSLSATQQAARLHLTFNAIVFKLNYVHCK